MGWENLKKHYFVALYQWISSMEHSEMKQRLLECLHETGLEIDPEFPKGKNIYARDSNGSKGSWNTRVNITISPNTSSANEYVVEVRSAEPMLKKGTRCEKIASKVKSIILPKS